MRQLNGQHIDRDPLMPEGRFDSVVLLQWNVLWIPSRLYHVYDIQRRWSHPCRKSDGSFDVAPQASLTRRPDECLTAAKRHVIQDLHSLRSWSAVHNAGDGRRIDNFCASSRSAK